jgi:hypothetical protein
MSVFVWRELYDLTPEPLYAHFAFVPFHLLQHSGSDHESRQCGAWRRIDCDYKDL